MDPALALGLTMVAAAQMLAVRAALVAADAAIHLILLVDFITAVAMFAVGGVLIGRWLLWVATLPALGAGITLAAPDAAQFIYPGYVVAFLHGWTRSSRAAQPTPPQGRGR